MTIVSGKVHINVRKVAIIQEAGAGSLRVIVTMILSADISTLKEIATIISINFLSVIIRHLNTLFFFTHYYCVSIMAKVSNEEIQDFIKDETEHTTPYETLVEAVAEATIQGNAKDDVNSL